MFKLICARRKPACFFNLTRFGGALQRNYGFHREQLCETLHLRLSRWRCFFLTGTENAWRLARTNQLLVEIRRSGAQVVCEDLHLCVSPESHLFVDREDVTIRLTRPNGCSSDSLPDADSLPGALRLRRKCPFARGEIGAQSSLPGIPLGHPSRASFPGIVPGHRLRQLSPKTALPRLFCERCLKILALRQSGRDVTG